MAIIGVLHLTSIITSATSTQPPGAAIVSHISDSYPTQSLHSFQLDHRLFVSTSSLLPHAENKRAFTHFFTSSHTPQKTYVGTTSSHAPDDGGVAASRSDSGLCIITIPTSTSLEPFTSLLMQKLQPQWAPRQFLVLDSGTSIVLPIADDAIWKITVGDLRLAPSKVSGSAVGQPRGVLIELQYERKDEGTTATLNDEDKKKYETLFRALLKGLFRDLKLDLKLDDAKIYLAKTSSELTENQSQKQEDRQQSQFPGGSSGYQIAELYMEVLRGSRN